MASMSPATRFRPTTPARLKLRAVLNLVNLTTPLGLGIALLGRARITRGHDRLWLAEHYRLKVPAACAFTVGNVVTTHSTFNSIARWGPDILGHEDRHAWQYARLGLLFFPLYAAASAWSWVRYRSPAVGNVFERRAGLVSGHYLASGAPLPSPNRDRRALVARKRPKPLR